MNSATLVYQYAVRRYAVVMRTSTLIENVTFVELPTTAYWYAEGNNMDSPTMAYWYALRTGMQKRDDSSTNRGTLQVYLLCIFFLETHTFLRRVLVFFPKK
jgi:hypothetical protein